MADRSQHRAAFDRIADLLRTGAAANARALAAHRGRPAEADVERHLEHTLDRLAWLYGRGTYENLSTVAIFHAAINNEVQLAQELSEPAAAEARARAQRLVDAARRGVRLHVRGVSPVELWRGVHVEPLRPEFERRLLATETPFIRRHNGVVVVLPESELDDLRAAGDQVDVLFLDSDELLDLDGRGDRAALESELARRVAIARTAPDFGDSRPAYLLRQLLKQSTVLRNLRDRLVEEHPAAHRVLLPILADHRALLETALTVAPPGRAAVADPLHESIDCEHELQTLVTRWAAEPDDTAGLLGRFKAVAEAGSHLAKLELHR